MPEAVTTEAAVALPGSTPPLLVRQVRHFAQNQRLMSIADQVVVSATNFLTTVVIGRIAGQDALGSYSLAFSVMMIALAMQESLICLPYTVRHRKLTRPARRSLAGSALIQALVFGLMLSLLLTTAASVVFEALSEVSPGLPWVLAMALPFILLRDFVRRICFARLESLGALVIDSAVFLLQIGLLLLVWQLHKVTTTFSIAIIALACGVPAFCWIWQHRGEFRGVTKGSLSQDVRGSWALGSWVLGSQATSVLTSYSMYWFVAAMLGTTASGDLTAASAIVLLANPILLGTYNYLTPRLVAADAEEGSRGVLRVALNVTCFLAGAMALFAVGAFAFGGLFVRLVYGEGFTADPLVSGLFGLSVLASAVGVAAEHTLWVKQRSPASFWTGLTGLVAMGAVTLPAISTWGLPGALAGLLLGNTTTSVLRWVVAARVLSERDREALL